MIKKVDAKLLTAYRSTSDKVYPLSETMSEMQGKQKMEGGGGLLKWQHLLLISNKVFPSLPIIQNFRREEGGS